MAGMGDMVVVVVGWGKEIDFIFILIQKKEQLALEITGLGEKRLAFLGSFYRHLDDDEDPVPIRNRVLLRQPRPITQFGSHLFLLLCVCGDALEM